MDAKFIDKILQLNNSNSLSKESLLDLFDISNSNKYSISNLIDMFIKDKTIQQLSTSTISSYKLQLRKFFEFVKTDNINNITKFDILTYFDYKKQQDNLKNTSLATIRYVLLSFYNWLVSEDIVKYNPVEKIKPFKIDRNIDKSLTHYELEIIRDSCQTPRQKALIECFYCTGCRLSELANIKISDVDWKNERIKVLGKGKKERFVFLSTKAIIYLKKYLKSRTDDCEYLFVTQRKPITKIGNRAIEKEIKKINNLANVDKPTSPHYFRHTMISDLSARGMPVTIIKQIAGHDDINTTMRYVHISNEIKQNAYKQYFAQ